MDGAFALAQANLLSPAVLFFLLGLVAALVRSDLTFPEAAAKALALYLMMAIGLKGGFEVARAGADQTLFLSIGAGIALSLIIPIIAFVLLRTLGGLSQVNAAAVAGHYGSISIVTFVAASQSLVLLGVPFEGFMPAVAAAMEAPAIFIAIWLATRGRARDSEDQNSGVLREVALNGSIVLLIGAFAIGVITGQRGAQAAAPLIGPAFPALLMIFLLDMGLVAGRSLLKAPKLLNPRVVLFGLIMPLISASLAMLVAGPIGLSAGGAALMITLCASASYIAAPAAMRLALPEAPPGLYLTLSLGVTFPFNLTLGIPLYIVMGQWSASW